MAVFEFDGKAIDLAIEQIGDMADMIDRNGPRAAIAGARAAIEVMEKSVPVRTGGLKGHLTYKGPFHSATDGYYCDVFPSGTKKNGKKRERYETVGFVLEHGRSNMKARPWMRPALEDGSGHIAQAIHDKLFEE